MQVRKLQKFPFKRRRAYILLMITFRGSCFLLQSRAERKPASLAVTSALQHTQSKAFPRSFFLNSRTKLSVLRLASGDMESRQHESAAKSHLASTFAFPTVLCSGRGSSIREAAVFIFLFFFYSTTITVQVVAVISGSEGFGAVLFLADAAKHVIGVKLLYNELLYVKKH